MNWFKKAVAAVLVAGTLCAPVTVYAADNTTAITATAETQSTSMYVNKKCYSYDSPYAGHKQLELIYSGTKVTVVGSTGQYYKLDDGSYILTKYVNPTATSWRYYKYSKPVTMYATKSVIIRSKALTSAARTGSVKADQKLTVVGYTNTGFYRLENGKYIKTTYATKTKPVEKAAANPASDFEYTTDNNEVTITKYIGTDKTVIIPSKINGKPVTKLASSYNLRFDDSGTALVTHYSTFNENVTSVVIPKSVTEIGDYTFKNCTSLTSVVIPDSVTTIGYGAFNHCTSLTSVVIPDGVTKIGDLAFYECSRLSSINIPDSVTEIGRNAFSFCECLGYLTIPASVTKIGWNAFVADYFLVITLITKDKTEVKYFGDSNQIYYAINK